MSAANLLNLTCTLTSPTVTVGASGGNVRSYSNVATAVRCAIQAARTHEQSVAARETGITEFVVFFMPDQTLAPYYRMTSIAGGMGYAGAWASKTLELVSLWEDGVGRGQYKKALARLVEGGPTG